MKQKLPRLVRQLFALNKSESLMILQQQALPGCDHQA